MELGDRIFMFHGEKNDPEGALHGDQSTLHALLFFAQRRKCATLSSSHDVFGQTATHPVQVSHRSPHFKYTTLFPSHRRALLDAAVAAGVELVNLETCLGDTQDGG
jgi:hypothetical protein